MLTSEIEMIPTVPSFCQTCINNSQSKHKRQYGASPSRLLSFNSQYICRNGTADFPRSEGYNFFGVLDELLNAEEAAALRIPVQNALQNMLPLETTLQPKKPENVLMDWWLFMKLNLCEKIFSAFCLWASQSVTASFLLTVLFLFGKRQGTARWPTVCATRKMGACY